MAKQRTEDRTKIMVRANVRDAYERREICILDISTRGLLASASDAPVYGEFIEIEVDDKVLVGQVKWSKEGRFGVVFQQRISVISFLSGEKGSIALPRKAVATTYAKNPAATFDASRQLSQWLQFGVFAAAAFVAAMYIMQAIHAGLGSITIPDGA
ncbi:MAG: PilZ domain-containing protein [Pseudomonadota bacterium]